MKVLNRTALGGLLRLVASLAGTLFLPAWTLDYWQAWIFLAVFSVSVPAITMYLMARDPSGPRTRSAASGIGLNQECGDERPLCANSSGERAL